LAEREATTTGLASGAANRPGSAGLIVVLLAVVVVDGWRAFGRGAEGARRERMQRSPQWLDDQFENPQPLCNDVGGMLESYGLMHQAMTVPHGELVEFVRERRLYGREIGWMDVHLLASAIVGGHRLWTAHPRFAAAAEELKIAFEPGHS
jgi:hypothetical protein